MQAASAPSPSPPGASLPTRVLSAECSVKADEAWRALAGDARFASPSTRLLRAHEAFAHLATHASEAGSAPLGIPAAAVLLPVPSMASRLWGQRSRAHSLWMPPCKAMLAFADRLLHSAIRCRDEETPGSAGGQRLLTPIHIARAIAADSEFDFLRSTRSPP
jgi:hypothetical protein